MLCDNKPKLELTLAEVQVLILLVNQLGSYGLRLTGYELSLLDRLRDWSIEAHRASNAK
jgi:hypothetical protein